MQNKNIKKRGAPKGSQNAKKKITLNEKINIRCLASQRESYKKAAENLGITTTKFILDACDERAKKVLK